MRLLSILILTLAAACAGPRQSADPPAADGSLAPHLAGSGERIVLSWVEPDPARGPTLRFSTRERGVWGSARSVVSDPALAADSVDVPSVVPLAGGGLAAHWTVKRHGSDHARDLFVATSAGGVSWSAPARPHRDDTDSEHGMASIVPAASGNGFSIVWLDGRAGELSEYGRGGTALYEADSDGAAFAPETELDPRVCDCCKTSAAPGPSGPIVAYRDRTDGERRDISLIARRDGAWSEPTPVHDDGWSLTACPTNGPSVASRGSRVAVAWFTGAHATPSVWAASSADGGRTLGAPLRIDGGSPSGRVEIAMLDDGAAAVVWLEKKGERAAVRVRRVAADGTLGPPVIVAETSASRASGYPRIAALDRGSVLIAWTEVGAKSRVRAKVIALR